MCNTAPVTDYNENYDNSDENALSTND